MQCDLLQASADLSPLFTGCTVSILIVDQKKRQEIVPAVSLKPVASRKLQQIMKAFIK